MVQVVAMELRAREEIIEFLKWNLPQAEERMKRFVDTHCAEHHFTDWVYLKLQPHHQNMVAVQ